MVLLNRKNRSNVHQQRIQWVNCSAFVRSGTLQPSDIIKCFHTHWQLYDKLQNYKSNKCYAFISIAVNTILCEGFSVKLNCTAVLATSASVLVSGSFLDLVPSQTAIIITVTSCSFFTEVATEEASTHFSCKKLRIYFVMVFSSSA